MSPIHLTRYTTNPCSPVMPALFQTATLALLSAAIPMRATATASVVAVVLEGKTKKMVADPTPRELEAAQSVHVLAFTSNDELLLAESEGDFTVKEWDEDPPRPYPPW